MLNVVLLTMLLAVGNLQAFQAVGGIQCVDADKGVLQIFANGQNRTVLRVVCGLLQRRRLAEILLLIRHAPAAFADELRLVHQRREGLDIQAA